MTVSALPKKQTPQYPSSFFTGFPPPRSFPATSHFLPPSLSLSLSDRVREMAGMVAWKGNLVLRQFFHVTPPLRLVGRIPETLPCVPVGVVRVRCAASDSGEGGRKVSARLSQMQQILQDAEERALSAGCEPTPKITLDHVTVSFARSGGPGGQNVNKVNTKVDMRFNLKSAYWLGDRIRERIMQMEKNRINKDGEIVISSTKTRTQKGNIEDALEKLQAIIDAASYVPPPPSEEQKKRIAKLAAIGESKRLESKKALSQKKATRRSRDSWD